MPFDRGGKLSSIIYIIVSNTYISYDLEVCKLKESNLKSLKLTFYNTYKHTNMSQAF